MQVADINLEFFHVRFLLACLMRGQEQRLFACIVDGRIVGMLFLALKTALFYSGLEIKYIATLRGRRSDDEEPPPRGVGRFLVAGTWLLWKTAYSKAREIVLDSETGARRFYEHHGFVSKGPHRYVLSNPSPDLLRTILMMAENCPGLPPKVALELGDLVMQRIKLLRRHGRNVATARCTRRWRPWRRRRSPRARIRPSPPPPPGGCCAAAGASPSSSTCSPSPPRTPRSARRSSRGQPPPSAWSATTGSRNTSNTSSIWKTPSATRRSAPCWRTPRFPAS